MPDTPPSLLIRMRGTGDAASWRQFYEQYWRLIYAFARECGARPDEAEDVVQDVVTAVFAALPRFEYDRRRGRFRAWLRTITQNRVTDLLRRRAARPATVSLTPSGNGNQRPQLADPASESAEVIWERGWRRNLLQVCLDRVAREVEPRTFQAFQLYVLDGLSATETAAGLKMSAASVYMAKSRVVQRLRYWYEKELCED